MEFFINHTHKQIEFAGNNAHLHKFLDRLSELVETKKWSFKDDIQLYIHGVDAERDVRARVEHNGYNLDEEYWYVFFPDESEEQVYESYERELAREAASYADDDRHWSGWDTVGATTDI